MSFIKKLNNKVNKGNNEKMQINFFKLEAKMNKHYKNEIPEEIEIHLNLLKEKILKDLEPSPSPSLLSQSDKYIQLLDSYEAGDLKENILDKIIKKYNIEIDISNEYGDNDEEEANVFEKMIAISINKKAFNDKKIQNIINNNNTFSEEEIQGKKNKSKTPLVKSLTPSKSKSPKKSPKKSHKKILDDLKNNKLNQEEMDKILKNLNLKTQKEYLKELIMIGLDKI